LTLINSTLSGNYAKVSGGGIYHSGSIASLYNATIASNTANSDGSGSGFGGGVYNASGTVNLQNSILGWNLYVYQLGGHLIIDNEDCSGTLTSGGYNILSVNTDCTFNSSAGDQVGTLFNPISPNLAPLASYGGATQTRALLPGSPAIDAGNPGGCTDTLGAPLTTDQRGYHRPAFGGIALRCDIGAFELQQMLLLPLILK
jgi:predicted outer membrane repeat protein